MSQDHRVGGNKGARGILVPPPILGIISGKIFILKWPSICPPRFVFPSVAPASKTSYDDNNSGAAENCSNTAEGAQSLQRINSVCIFFCFCPLNFLTFHRPCNIDFYDDNNSSAAKDDSNTAGGAQSLQRMDSAPAFFFALQTLGQSLQDNDNNKRPLGQSYSDDGSKVWNWDSLDEKLSFLFFPFFFFFFLFSTVIFY